MIKKKLFDPFSLYYTFDINNFFICSERERKKSQLKILPLILWRKRKNRDCVKRKKKKKFAYNDAKKANHLYAILNNKSDVRVFTCWNNGFIKTVVIWLWGIK